MEIKTLTPLQLWQDFNPVKEPLNLNIIDFKTNNGYNYITYGYTIMTAHDGKVRGIAKSVYRAGAANLPVVMYIPDFEELIDLEKLLPLAEQGYACVTFDYTGESNQKDFFTSYPISLNYGNIRRAGEHLKSAKYGADNTSLFLWCKVARRTISLISELPYADASSIAGIAFNNGANILWQVAGIDGRFKGIIPIMNNGFSDFNGNDKDDNSQSFDEEATRWKIACSVPSYAKFITSAVLFIGTTNNETYPYDRLEETMRLLPCNSLKSNFICAGLSNNLYSGVKSTVIEWLDSNIRNKSTFADTPIIKLSIVDDNIVATVIADTKYNDITDATIYVSYGDLIPCLRNWTAVNIGIGMDGTGKSRIKVYDPTIKINLFANITYKNDVSLSTVLATFLPDELGRVKLNIKNNRIIFEKKLGANVFFSETKELFTSDKNIRFENGAMDISGITTAHGNMVCYNIGDVNNIDADTMLQFDSFSLESKTFTVLLIDGYMREYSLDITVNNIEEWSKFKLRPFDFKDNELIPLKDWSGVKVLKFINAENVLFNNILWV